VSTFGTSGSGGQDHSVGSHINPVGAPSTTGAGSSHAGRDAAILGGAGGAGLIGGAAATRYADNSGTADRSLPLGSNSSATTAPAPTGLSSYNDSSSFGRDNGLVGSTGLVGTGTATTSTVGNSGRGRTVSPSHPQGQQLDCDGNPVRGYVHHTSGPHSTDIANQLDVCPVLLTPLYDRFTDMDTSSPPLPPALL
jgi:hypothetical protein